MTKARIKNFLRIRKRKTGKKVRLLTLGKYKLGGIFDNKNIRKFIYESNRY